MAAKHSLEHHLQSATAPWSSLVVIPQGATAKSVIRPPSGFALRTVNGKQCGTPAKLFDEFARAMEFPDYFGRNWDALEECLADLEWLPANGYVVLITEAQAVLPDDDDEYETFLEVLSDAGEAWSKGQGGTGRIAPFHVLLAVSQKEKGSRKHWGVEEVSARESGPQKRSRARS